MLKFDELISKMKEINAIDKRLTQHNEKN